MELFQRVLNVLTKPKSEWQVIEAEEMSVRDLFIKYVLVLAAIPSLASLIGGLAGQQFLLTRIRIPFGMVLESALMLYVLNVGIVYLIGTISDALAANFGGVRNLVQAMKLAVYSYTAWWVVGCFQLFPGLGGGLAVLGLYSAYLFYVGAPSMLKIPEDKVLGFAIVVMVIAMVVMAVVRSVLPISPMFFGVRGMLY